MKYIELIGENYEEVMGKVQEFIYQDSIKRVISIKTVEYKENFIATVVYK